MWQIFTNISKQQGVLEIESQLKDFKVSAWEEVDNKSISINLSQLTRPDNFQKKPKNSNIIKSIDVNLTKPFF